MKRILIVANRTLCEQHLLDEVRRRKQASPVSFHVLVPATHGTGTWSDRQAESEARERLDELLDTLAVAGIPATGEIGDARPVYAVQDVLRRWTFDEIILSTLPVGLSRWMGQNVLRRLRHETGLPVTHVVAERMPSNA
jgi:hypothetical protein